MLLNKNSRFSFSGPRDRAVSHALAALARDWEKVFGSPLRMVAAGRPADIEIINQSSGAYDESFSVSLSPARPALCVSGTDTLGTIFGIYHVCENILGVDPFYFWTDFVPRRRHNIVMRHYEFHAALPEYRFRGWFVNDEDCLIGWHDDECVSCATWAAIYETMLRCGCNIVIPGTAAPFDAPQVKQAADMGLWIGQHHAEPLGAHMFSNKYPKLKPDPIKYKRQFESLYREAIKGYLANDVNVIFNLGFRGQGDRPFWCDIPQYRTPKARAAIISHMIEWQKKLVKKESNGRYKHFSVYVYGELAALVRDGHLKFDDDIILIWSDNGYGAMRTRRMGKIDPVIEVMPLIDNTHPRHGVYYHVNFHDLQASNHLTMLVPPRLIVNQFAELAAKKVKTCMILNVGNIRPHVYEIELLSKIALGGVRSDSCNKYLDKHLQAFCGKHFGKHAASAGRVYAEYFQTTFCTGPNTGELAGEELYHYAIRSMVHYCIGNAMWDYFMFTGDPDMPFDRRLAWYIGKTGEAVPRWNALLKKYVLARAKLSGKARCYFDDNIGMQIKYCQHSNMALCLTSRAVQKYIADSADSGCLMHCFLLITKAKAEVECALQSLLQTEHGKWKNFYRGDWLTATRMTLRFLNAFRSVIRIRGERHPYESWLGTAGALSKTPGLLAVIDSKKVDDDDEYARLLNGLKQV